MWLLSPCHVAENSSLGDPSGGPGRGQEGAGAVCRRLLATNSLTEMLRGSVACTDVPNVCRSCRETTTSWCSRRSTTKGAIWSHKNSPSAPSASPPIQLCAPTRSSQRNDREGARPKAPSTRQRNKPSGRRNFILVTGHMRPNGTTTQLGATNALVMAPATADSNMPCTRSGNNDAAPEEESSSNVMVGVLPKYTVRPCISGKCGVRCRKATNKRPWIDSLRMPKEMSTSRPNENFTATSTCLPGNSASKARMMSRPLDGSGGNIEQRLTMGVSAPKHTRSNFSAPVTLRWISS
mmetsp:Transcript_94642/g.271461  ORF Transcript_94642/g.271461 Transcript_94642/m.271461 type:complete len:294 (-) Transcript_94642:315-1196(-)